MKKTLIMMLSFMFSATACASDNNKVDELEIRELSPKARKMLGLDEKDYGNTSLIAITSKGPILYNVSKGTKILPTDGEGKESPLNRTLVGKYTIFRFKNSPECDYFEFNNRRYWYPKPPCPTN